MEEGEKVIGKDMGGAEEAGTQRSKWVVKKMQKMDLIQVGRTSRSLLKFVQPTVRLRRFSPCLC